MPEPQLSMFYLSSTFNNTYISIQDRNKMLSVVQLDRLCFEGISSEMFVENYFFLLAISNHLLPPSATD